MMMKLLDITIWVGVVLLVGIILGAGIAWILSRPGDDDAWLEMNRPITTYTPHDMKATTEWLYLVERPCETITTLHYLIVLWDGEIRVFSGHGPDVYSEGPGRYKETIGWPEEWAPHGAVMRLVVTCLTRRPEILISPGGPVRVMDMRGLPAKPEDFVATRRPRVAQPG